MIRIYRNVYLKGYDKFPYQKLSGRRTLLYTGKIICGVSDKPDDFDNNKDIYLNCECDFSKWKELKKIFQK